MQTTELGSRLLWTAVMVLLIALIFILIARSWHKLQGSGTTARVPSNFTPVLTLAGTYASTSRHERWNERIRGYRLAARGPVQVMVAPSGVLFERKAEQDLFVPSAEISSVSVAPGIAGKVVGGQGIVIVTWRLDSELVDTGVHIQSAEERDSLVRAISGLIHE